MTTASQPGPNRISQEILAEMKEQNRLLRGILAALSGGGAAARNGRGDGASNAGGAVADDRELDSDKGDPTVQRDPKRWKGESFIGCRFSECTPDYLDVMAEQKDWQADNPREGKEQYAKYDRKDAARARGWARRIRNGWQPAGEPRRGQDEYGDDVPL